MKITSTCRVNVSQTSILHRMNQRKPSETNKDKKFVLSSSFDLILIEKKRNVSQHITDKENKNTLECTREICCSEKFGSKDRVGKFFDYQID